MIATNVIGLESQGPVKPRSVVKAIRLSPELIATLETAAKENNRTVSSLVQGVLSSYFEWDEKAKRFGFVQIPTRLLRRTFDKLTLDSIKQLASLNLQLTRELTMFWYGRYDAATVIQLGQLFSQYSGIYKSAYDLKGGTAVGRHELGSNWSRFNDLTAQRISKDLGINLTFSSTDEMIGTKVPPDWMTKHKPG